MINIFFRILKKTFQVVKKEPVILIPYLMFHLVITTLSQTYSFSENHMILNGVLQWGIPTLVLQPFILLVALNVIQNKEIQLQHIITKQKQCLWPFFVGSLYKPLLFLAAYKLMKVMPDEGQVDSILVANSMPWFGLLVICIFVSIGMVFFQAYFIANQHKWNGTQLVEQMKSSILIFFHFKWVTISFILYFYVCLFVVLSFVVAGFVSVIPNHLLPMVLNSLNGMIITLLQVFILRLFLYIKPIAVN